MEHIQLYRPHGASGSGHELDAYMTLCSTLIHLTGETAKTAESYRLYGDHDWEYREPALKSEAAREQGYRTLLAFSGEGKLCGGTTFRRRSRVVLCLRASHTRLSSVNIC